MNQFHIDPTFSVYRLTKRSMRDTAVMNHRRTMSIISSEIENATLVDGAETVIFAAFQGMSKFIPQVKRYRKLAEKAKHVYVFGVVDCPIPEIENITYVPLKPADQLAKEWFLVSFGRDYFSALATEELSNIDDPDEMRQFKGVWSFDIFLVGILHEWLSNIVGLRLDVQDQSGHDYLKQAELISNSIGRMTLRVMDNKGKDDVVYQELEKIMQGSLHPAYHHLIENPTVETLQAKYHNAGSA